MEDVRSKAIELMEWFKKFRSVIVAFSGGIDSTLVAYVARKVLNDNAIAVTARLTSIPDWEIDEAKRIASIIDIKHIVIDIDETLREEYVRNLPDRCFYCKEELYSKMLSLAKEMNIQQVIDGTNYDDLKDFRPGIKAAEKLGVRSPLAELHIGKDMVKKLSMFFNLPTASKPSSPCLASRVMYGQPLSKELLAKIASAELFIKNATGVKILRFRVHDDIARIEVGKDEIRMFVLSDKLDEIVKFVKDLGFSFVTLDLEGYRPGSLLNSYMKKRGAIV